MRYAEVVAVTVCPTCHVQVGQRCHRVNGSECPPHAPRQRLARMVRAVRSAS